MNFIKAFLQKFGSGLFIGIVAGITAGFIFGIISMLLTQSIWNGDAEIMEQAKIIEDREVNRNGKTIIFGTIQNNSEDMMKMFKVKVDLYDENGTFVEQCENYISDVPGGKKTNFKVLCKSCDSNITAAHESYQVYLGGY